ncbi:hypothetical protein [Micromonospora sp. CB01531]|uniref:hypothetical protein n=1 Tax=Micromonospora sp. CB01531 TaxID=1718947 RepID=UPI000AF706F8|nr:hypothetical protein [Micromonospora sp. CB01531]
MAWRVGTPKIDGRKMVQIINTTGKYEKYAKGQLRRLREIAIEIYHDREVGGPWRKSNTSPPKYVEVFVIRKYGMNYRLVNRDPGAQWVEWGAHAGGKVAILKYAPMRTALDRLEAEERLQ